MCVWGGGGGWGVLGGGGEATTKCKIAGFTSKE